MSDRVQDTDVRRWVFEPSSGEKRNLTKSAKSKVNDENEDVDYGDLKAAKVGSWYQSDVYVIVVEVPSDE